MSKVFSRVKSISDIFTFSKKGTRLGGFTSVPMPVLYLPDGRQWDLVNIEGVEGSVVEILVDDHVQKRVDGRYKHKMTGMYVERLIPDCLIEPVRLELVKCGLTLEERERLEKKRKDRQRKERNARLLSRRAFKNKK